MGIFSGCILAFAVVAEGRVGNPFVGVSRPFVCMAGGIEPLATVWSVVCVRERGGEVSPEILVTAPIIVHSFYPFLGEIIPSPTIIRDLAQKVYYQGFGSKVNKYEGLTKQVYNI